MEQEFIEILGTVEDVVYHNDENGFTVIELSTEDEYITVVGSFSEVAIGEELKLRGSWVMHHTFGRQFRAELYERKMPSNAADLYKYLASGAVTGIGPKTAQKIIERFGDDSFDVLEKYPEKLTVIKEIIKNLCLLFVNFLNCFNATLFLNPFKNKLHDVDTVCWRCIVH